jgi:hypothetical protein
MFAPAACAVLHVASSNDVMRMHPLTVSHSWGKVSGALNCLSDAGVLSYIVMVFEIFMTAILLIVPSATTAAALLTQHAGAR